MIYKSFLIENKINSLNKRILFFYGENLGLKNNFKEEIKNSNKNLKILKYVQEEILKDLTNIEAEINNLSLFDDKKIIFIENANDKILDFIKSIPENLTNCEISIFAGNLDKRSKLREFFEKSKNDVCVPCYEDNELTIKKIILKELTGFEGLNTENIQIILQNSNLDRIKLYNELRKIKHFFTDKKLKTKELSLLQDEMINDNFSRLNDEALKGNKIATNKLLSETILDQDKYIYYLNSINVKLRRIYEINKIKKGSLEQSINELKPPVFWKDKPNLTAQARIWSITKIKEALNKTYKLEILIKSNSLIDKKNLIKKTIVDLCQIANA